MPILEQIETLRAYLRTLHSDFNRAYREDSAQYRKRRISPFVANLRYRRFTNASELRQVAEECLRQLRQARALSIAEWKPGDQILVEVILKGLPRDPRRYVITDVEWSKPDAYHYVVTQLTNAGHPYKRGGDTWVSPSSRIRITKCAEALPEGTLRQCAHYRRNAEHFLDDARDRGDIDHIVKWVQEKRAKDFY